MVFKDLKPSINVHLRSAQTLATKINVLQQEGERPSLLAKEESSSTVPPVFEDISEDKSSKGLDSEVKNIASVAFVFCSPDESSVDEDERATGELAQEHLLLRMDRETELRELVIIETLMRRINTSAKTTLSWSLVSSMKKDYPELTTERINALFTWTVWMSRQCASISSSAPPENLPPPSGSAAEDSSGSLKSFECVSKVSSDPLLCQANSGAVRTPAARMRDVACELETIVSELDSPVRMSMLDMDRTDPVSGENVTFPELFQNEEMDFDFGD